MRDWDPVEAYHRALFIRHVEQQIASRYPEEKMRLPVHLSIGQEVAAVAVCMALEEDDHVYASHRSHAPYLAKGGDLRAMLSELYGQAGGCTGGRGGSMYLTDKACGFMGSFAVVGDCISLATGAALGAQIEGSGRMAVAWFGEAAVETGQFWESVNFASLHNLPILYVCENNGYATQTPLAQRQPTHNTIAQRVGAFMPNARVPDREPEIVFAQTQHSREALPFFLEVETYRFREHVGPNFDSELGYRDPEEVSGRIYADPLSSLHRELTRTSQGTAACAAAKVDAEILVDGAFAEVES